MLHQLQHLMASPTVFSKLEITTLVIVTLVAGMVLGGMAGTSPRLASMPRGFLARSRGPASGGRADRPSRLETASGFASAGWAGAGLDAVSHGDGVWVTVSGAGNYYPAASRPEASPSFPPGVYQSSGYRVDVIEQRAAVEQMPMRDNRALWRLGTALFSAARSETIRAFTPLAESPRLATGKPGRHRAPRNKRVRDTEMAGAGAGSSWVRTS